MPVTTEDAAFRPEFAQRLKTLAVSDALRWLAACVRSQAIAQDAFDAAARAVAREQERATCSTSDNDVEAFAAWLPEARQAVHRAGTRLKQAAQSAANARVALRLARAALIAHDHVISRRATSRSNWPISPQSGGSTRTAPHC